jgi:hypothetical protein
VRTDEVDEAPLAGKTPPDVTASRLRQANSTNRRQSEQQWSTSDRMSTNNLSRPEHFLTPGRRNA